ncbi:hypothetical protein GCM10007876_39630 [Litoribrevibacter albus]|uniref:Polyhydroxyalkanoic acid synthase n=2 Tax=Litoribrevibacter albus TaxID=1473156 RepID=A0AA37SF07_9GAMM|nr:hypothetical protein GCM10007876_39630 [Litoribrevibacter albus]
MSFDKGQFVENPCFRVECSAFNPRWFSGMAKISVKKDHNLGLEQALKDAEQLALMLADRFDAKYEWKGNKLVFHRTGVKGFLDVTETTLEIHVELALLMRPFKAVVEREIHNYLEKELR